MENKTKGERLKQISTELLFRCWKCGIKNIIKVKGNRVLDDFVTEIRNEQKIKSLREVLDIWDKSGSMAELKTRLKQNLKKMSEGE